MKFKMKYDWIIQSFLLTFLFMVTPTGFMVKQDRGFNQFLDALYQHSFKNSAVVTAFFLATLFITYSFKNTKFDEKTLKVTKITSIPLSILYMLFMYIELNHGFGCIFQNVYSFIEAIVRFFGFYTLFTIFINYSLYFMNKVKTRKQEKESLFNRYPFRFSFVVLLVCWLPWIIAFYPGPVNWDGLRQLDFYIGSLDWSKFHPVLSTWWMGTVFYLGKSIFGTDNGGVFLYTILQVILVALSVSAGIKILKNKGVSLGYRKLVLAFFALFLMWPSLSYTFYKDSSFMITFFWHVILLVVLYNRKEDEYTKDLWFFLFLDSLLMCHTRNNGIYNLIIELPFVYFLFRKERKRIVGVFLIPILITMIFNSVLVPKMGIKNGSVAEMLSIPFQQTARYVNMYDKEVTKEEKEIIDTVLDYKTMKEDYKPEISDDIKIWLGIKNAPMQKCVEYVGVWFHQFLKHPVCYFEATFANVHGYFYPMVREQETLLNDHHTQAEYVNRGDFNFTMNEKSSSLREMLSKLLLVQKQMPITSLLYCAGVWMLLLLITTLYLFINHGKLTIFTLPLWITLLVCVAGPVNAHLRYIIPNIMTMPFLFGLSLYSFNKNQIDL